MKTNPTNQLIEEALKRYDRIFKGTVMWKEQRSFLREELNLIATKSAEEERERIWDYIEENLVHIQEVNLDDLANIIFNKALSQKEPNAK